MKKMNIIRNIRNIFRYLFQPIEVEVRFPLIVWVVWAIFAIEILLAVIISIIGKVEILCK